jgi:uncharacterized protein with von Willebrand factor type A (vWA) domain
MGAPADSAQLVAHVLHFARLLRRAGLPIGSDRVLWAVRALQVGGLERRSTCHAALSACLLDRPEQQPLFDQAFAWYWRLSQGEAASSMAALSDVHQEINPGAEALSPRLLEALGAPSLQALPPDGDEWPVRGQAASAWERLHRTDFAALSTAEWQEAMRLLAALPVVFPPRSTRRRAPSATPGRVDLRASLRAAARGGMDLARLRHSRPRLVLPCVVLLADISGSMAPYARMLLHLAHLLAQGPVQAESFVFGTRLTRLTPWMRRRDPDEAVRAAAAAVADWSGGTRIAPSLHAFNQHWVRRLPGSRTTVLLVTDGLERGDAAALGVEMERLHKSCRSLVWLNPLLRYDRFEPRAAGIRAMRPHVDDLLPMHNLDSLDRLLKGLQQRSQR